MISEQDGIHLPSHEDNEVLETLHIEDAMISDVFCLEASLTIKQAAETIKDKNYSGYPVVRKGELIGMVSSNDILASVTKGDLDREVFIISERKVITVYPDQSLLVAFHKLRRFHVSRLPVVSRVNRRKILGIITAENIASKFGYHVTSEDDDGNKTPQE